MTYTAAVYINAGVWVCYDDKLGGLVPTPPTDQDEMQRLEAELRLKNNPLLLKFKDKHRERS